MKSFYLKNIYYNMFFLFYLKVDLSQIEAEFEKMYGKSLISWVKKETTGDYEVNTNYTKCDR